MSLPLTTSTLPLLPLPSFLSQCVRPVCRYGLVLEHQSDLKGTHCWYETQAYSQKHHVILRFLYLALCFHIDCILFRMVTGEQSEDTCTPLPPCCYRTHSIFTPPSRATTELSAAEPLHQGLSCLVLVQEQCDTIQMSTSDTAKCFTINCCINGQPIFAVPSVFPSGSGSTCLSKHPKLKAKKCFKYKHSNVWLFSKGFSTFFRPICMYKWDSLPPTSYTCLTQNISWFYSIPLNEALSRGYGYIHIT